MAVKREPTEQQLIVAEYLTKFGMIANRPPTANLMAIYEEALADLSVAQLRRGFKAWMRDGGHWPWPSDIREAAEL